MTSPSVRSGPREREYDEGSIHPADVIAKAHELGLMNVHIPEAYGGLELGAFEGMLIGEELCWGCSGIGTAIAANGLGHGPVIIAGTEEQKREWLPPLVEEPLLSVVRADRAQRRLRRVAASRRPPCATATTTSSTARRCSSRTRAMPPGSRSSSRRPTSRRAIAGCRRSSCRADSTGRRRQASRQDGPALDRHVRTRRSRTFAFRLRTGSARRARASRSR